MRRSGVVLVRGNEVVVVKLPSPVLLQCLCLVCIAHVFERFGKRRISGRTEQCCQLITPVIVKSSATKCCVAGNQNDVESAVSSLRCWAPGEEQFGIFLDPGDMFRRRHLLVVAKFSVRDNVRNTRASVR